MKILLITSMIISIVYMMSSTPVILLMLIVIQSLTTCVFVWIKLSVSWFSYIIFLIFLGGLMVVFIYITSLASNKKILLPTLSLKKSLFMFLMIMVIMSVTIFMNYPESSLKMNLIKSFNLIYNPQMMVLTSTTMIYLLLSLIVVVKMSNKFNAPIKSIYLN